MLTLVRSVLASLHSSPLWPREARKNDLTGDTEVSSPIGLKSRPFGSLAHKACLAITADSRQSANERRNGVPFRGLRSSRRSTSASCPGEVRMNVRAGCLVASLFIVAILVSAGSAAASCNPGRSNSSVSNQAGWLKGPPSGVCYDGSLANILVYSPYVAATDVTAWAMLYNNATGSYGQVGWLQQTSARYNFTESSTAGGGFHQLLLSGSSIGSSPAYKVTFSSDAFHFFIDGINVNTNYNTGYTGCYFAQAGEVTNSANQMPGGYNNHDTFTSGQVRRSDTGGWNYADATAYVQGPSSWYASSKVSSTEVDIWDKACAS